MIDLNKVTGKFWSFSDTKNYKYTNQIKAINDKVVRTFLFDKSYLLEIQRYRWDYKKEKKQYVVPIRFMTNNFPDGWYVDINNECFIDDEIINVIYRG
jgi:hypothetical protein